MQYRRRPPVQPDADAVEVDEAVGPEAQDCAAGDVQQQRLRVQLGGAGVSVVQVTLLRVKPELEGERKSEGPFHIWLQLSVCYQGNSTGIQKHRFHMRSHIWKLRNQ